MDDIKYIFSEHTESQTESFTFSEDGNYNLNHRPLAESSITGCISTLSELFTEWYLFDSSHEKNIPQFLAEEGLTDVFTESEFMDLICGGAYLDDTLIQFITLKIPFPIKTKKIQKLNRDLSVQNEKAYLVKSKTTTIEKIHEITQEKKAKKAKRNAEYHKKNRERILKQHHEYYLANREHILEKNKQWVLSHQEQYQKYHAQWCTENAEHLKEYHKKYRTENAVAVSERKKKCYNAKKEQYLSRNKANYEANKEKYLAHQKQHYEANKEKYLARQKQYYEEMKQKAESAKNMCAAYVFLLNLRKTDKEQYFKMYTEQAKPLTGMLKTCVALQNNDINLCPFCNSKSEQNAEQCCNQKVLSMDNATTMLKILANILNQR